MGSAHQHRDEKHAAAPGRVKKSLHQGENPTAFARNMLLGHEKPAIHFGGPDPRVKFNIQRTHEIAGINAIILVTFVTGPQSDCFRDFIECGQRHVYSGALVD